MAGSEGSGQTELLSGWSCVVHRPSEDPEPSELPSTVDMAAFSSGITVELTHNTNNEDSCDSESDSDSDSNNSGSDVSASCSQSDSSDSESSSSSQESSSRSSSPEFSVTSSQTNGLRLKIATIRKSCMSPIEKSKPCTSDAKICDKNIQNPVAKDSNLSFSSDSPSRSSSNSSSDSDVPSINKSDGSNDKTNEKSGIKKQITKVRLKSLEKKVEKRATRSVTANSVKSATKTKTKLKKTRKTMSLPLERGSTGSSSDSEDSSETDRTMLASCSLQEIRQEDLAAILPDQQECDTFGGFDCRADKSSPHTGDGSGSDMELPQQAVNALIQRTTESSSESESRLPLNPNTLYANSLLQQFVAQTQMLNAPCSTVTHTTDSNLPIPTQTVVDDTNQQAKPSSVKRKRGRPRKSNLNQNQANKPDKKETSKSLLNMEYCGNPNVSPDSGIQNSSDHVSSPESSPTPNSKPKFNQDEESKQISSSIQKHLSKNGVDIQNNLNFKSHSNKINKVKEQPKLSLTSNSFDRVLYGNTDRVLYPPRRKAGRPPCTRKGPGRPPKHKSTSAVVSQVIRSDSTANINKTEVLVDSQISKQNPKLSYKVERKVDKVKRNFKNNNISSNTVANACTLKKDISEIKLKEVKKNSKSNVFQEICAKVGKESDINENDMHCKSESTAKKVKNYKGVTSIKKGILNNKAVLTSKNKLNTLHPKYTTLKNAKVMHSKHDKRHKKCKFKILKPITETISDPKLNTEIEKLISDFVKLCNISSNKLSKENVPEILKVVKKASKKRKASDYSERKKKKQNISSSFNKETNCNEQRLPLKKRHYHISNNDSGNTIVQTDVTIDVKCKVVNNIKDAKSVTVGNYKVAPEKPKCINKSTSITSNISSLKVPIDSDVDQNVIEVNGNNATFKPSNFNNNDYTIKPPKTKAVGTHIDEAIEACITKYSSSESPALAVKDDLLKSNSKCESPLPKQDNTDSSNSSITTTTTTPKKRHRLEAKNSISELSSTNDLQDLKAESLNDISKNQNVLENVVTELKAKKNLSTKLLDTNNKRIKEDKKIETVAQIITRKKNRLEDLTLTLAHKVNSTYVEDICDNHQKKKRDIQKVENTVMDIKMKRKREFVKLDLTIDKSQKRKKESTEETNINNTHKRKKDTPPKVEENIDNSHKYKQEVIKADEHRKEATKIEDEEAIINHKKNCTEINEIRPDISLNNKTEVVKSEELSNGKKCKEETIASGELLSRVSVIKSPISKKAKPIDSERLDDVTADKPTGIFMPTIDIELQIPASKIQTLHTVADKPTVEMRRKGIKTELPFVYIKNLQIKDSKMHVNEIEANKMQVSDNVSCKKIRKRRSINRTGFPTVKKKKKKSFPADFTLTVQGHEGVAKQSDERNICDRVPQEGEKYSTFLQRTEKLNVSNVILEKLQKSVVMSHNHNEQKTLQSDIRIDLENTTEQLPNTCNIKQTVAENALLKLHTDNHLNGKNIKSSLSEYKDVYSDLDDISLETRLEMLNVSLGGKINSSLKEKPFSNKSIIRSEKKLFEKRRFRDLSPASSIDTVSEKKLREEVSCSGDEGRRFKKTPRWRKKYLLAGLFSDYYKEDDEAVRLKRTEAASKSKVVYNPQEHPYGLFPSPYHCGKYLRCRKIPFQLPYDLWWLHTNSQLPGRDIVPSWNYRKIRTNIYNVKTTAGTCEPQACNCSPSSGCGDDCINRLVLAECPATHKCQNQKIQKHEWAPGIEKFMTINKGWGVRTKLPIKPGEFILEYVGEVVSDQEFKERMASRYAHDIHHYCLHLDGGLVIDGHRMGGDGRFVNHSCEPNCEMQKWSVNGQFRMALFALRDIESCEELTYDYNFSLFNPAEGQECKCGSKICRGVIGGKSQRVRQSTSVCNSNMSSEKIGRVGRPRKNQAKRTTSAPNELPIPPISTPVITVPVVKPLSNAQKSYVRDHHCFLPRNLNRAKHNRDRSVCSMSDSTALSDYNTTTFINHLNALRQPRNIKTRRLAQAEDDPELKKVAQLASILKDLLNIITTAKDENSELLCTTFINLPSKRKVPEYYQRITDPIDLMAIEQNIATAVYRTVESFDNDMNRIFVNAVRFFGRTSEPGIAATRLKKIYFETKQQILSKLEAIGEKPPPTFISTKKKGEEEDVIRCICGMFRDEGLMIQCERCLVWQHCECVQADVAAPSYHCERCISRPVDFEIPLNEYTEHGHRYYLTLLRGDLQLRQGDTVYMLRDIQIPGTDRKHTYKTIGEIKYTDLDIFRIERLWKDCESGQRFAYGHHYLRPHETFHEPTRKFFPNEVMRVPLYEAVPVELVISHCWVMDVNTYCKGRPIGAPEEHIYICEYRVDKSARLFSKISKAKYPICTKTYAFEKFDVRLKISRTYTPHDLDPSFIKPRGRKPQENEDAVKELPKLPIHVPVVRTQVEKKMRLGKILLELLNKMPTKQALDVSYLLEGGRRRKKHLEK